MESSPRTPAARASWKTSRNIQASSCLRSATFHFNLYQAYIYSTSCKLFWYGLDCLVLSWTMQAALLTMRILTPHVKTQKITFPTTKAHYWQPDSIIYKLYTASKHRRDTAETPYAHHWDPTSLRPCPNTTQTLPTRIAKTPQRHQKDTLQATLLAAQQKLLVLVQTTEEEPCEPSPIFSTSDKACMWGLLSMLNKRAGRKDIRLMRICRHVSSYFFVVPCTYMLQAARGKPSLQVHCCFVHG